MRENSLKRSLLTVDELLLEFKSRLYHGTSSIFIDSILKKGLLGTPPQRYYSTEPSGWSSMAPIEGAVYLGTDISLAANAANNVTDRHGGFPVIVVMDANLDDPGRRKLFKPDEDYLLDLIAAASNEPDDFKRLFPKIPLKQVKELEEFVREKAGSKERAGRGVGTNDIYRDYEKEIVKNWPWVDDPDLSRYLHASLRHQGDITPNQFKQVLFTPAWLYGQPGTREPPDDPTFEGDAVKFKADRRQEALRLLKDELAERPDDDELRAKVREGDTWITMSIEERFTPEGAKRLEKLNQLGSAWYDFQRSRRRYWWRPGTSLDDNLRGFGGITNPFDLWFDYRAYRSKASSHKKWQRRY